MQNWKMAVESAGLENAGLENNGLEFAELEIWRLIRAISLHYHQSNNVCGILNYANVFIFVGVRLCMLFYESCVLFFLVLNA